MGIDYETVGPKVNGYRANQSAMRIGDRFHRIRTVLASIHFCAMQEVCLSGVSRCDVGKEVVTSPRHSTLLIQFKVCEFAQFLHDIDNTCE